ncbi:Adenine nucleotide transporter BT1, chloroplastic/mitochondrial [Sesamum alatum]|uniref:Adenine nucleotide transporter BT1, chloroplastic/mitochondrial n=1 Tax=Sesamum alatum TaxID=300844 RepID=A0AAE1Y2P0_9LAMI|nr:Adenine nucleotide transporter BT1, chloroplastic/mitochondrial [Sesamum alatum]
MQSLELKNSGFSSDSHMALQDCNFYPGGGLFASVGQMGNNENGGLRLPYADLLVKYITLPEGFKIFGMPEEEKGLLENRKKSGLRLKIKISNPSLRRLLSGGIAGAVSRTAVAPLETIRTHLMVGSCGNCTTDQVFHDIMKTDGWTGLFRGNFVNVIRVAPSKAIELLVYDTVNKNLSPKPGENARLPIPPSLVAGACAGVSSTLVTYPLELLKTRLTIQRGVYNGLMDAFVKILQEGGPGELYRGLTPSVIGVIPYAAANYSGAISSTATFPLEVARKHMQVGAVSGRQVYKNVLHALASILEHEGIVGLYKGLGPSCLKLVPAAGISFMCYEACKKILVEKEDEE